MEIQKNQTSFLSILFVGLLSIFYAEVNSGSSPLWFAVWWGWWGVIVVFELYLAHLLFYVNVALRTHRVSLTQLYLLGCLVGLYEGPITKVLWFGYPGQPTDTLILGFAVYEFIMLVFFWHPIFSFLLPVVFYELLSFRYLEKIGSPSWLEDSFFKTRPRFSKFVLLSVVIIGASFLSVNSHFNIGILLLSGVVNVGLLILFKQRLFNSTKLQGINSLYLSRKWLIVVSIYLVLLYSVMFPFIGADLIPGSLTLILTAVIYLFILGVFFMSPPTRKKKFLNVAENNFSSLIQKYWLLWLILILISPLPFLIPVYSIALVLIYLMLLGFGLLLFLQRTLFVFFLKVRGVKEL